MTSEVFKRNVAALKQIIPQYVNRQRGTIGQLDSDGAVDPNVTSGLSTGYVWVRLGNNRTATAVKNLRVENAPGLQVIVAENTDTKELEIISVDTVDAVVSFGSAAAGLNSPTKGTTIPTPVSARDITTGGLYAHTDGGLKIVVTEFYHMGGRWDGATTYTLTPTATSGMKAINCIGIDPATNAYVEALTADRNELFSDFYVQDIDAVISAQPSVYWIAGVELANGATTINTGRIADLRTWRYAEMTGADGSDPGVAGLVPEPAATDNTKFLRGDGTWVTLSSSFTVAGDSGSSQTVSTGDTLTISGGVGLASVASATDTITLNLDVNSLTADASPDGAADYVATWDASAGTHKKVLLDDLPGGGTGMTSFTLAGDSGSSQTISDGNTLTIAGGAGLASTASATDTVTLDLDINSLTTDASPDGAADYVPTYDASASAPKKVLLSTLLAAASASGSYWLPLAAPASPSAEDDEFADNSGGVPSGWTEVDHGSVTTVDENVDGLRLTQSTHAGSSVSGVYKAIPAGDFSIWTQVALYVNSTGASQGANAGLCLYQDATSSTGDMALFYLGLAASNVPEVALYTITQYNGTISGLVSGTAGNRATVPLSGYMRIRRTGTTYSFDFSYNGVGAVRIYTGTLSFTPTHFGVAVNNLNSGAGIRGVFSFFRYSASDVGILAPWEGRRVNYYA